MDTPVAMPNQRTRYVAEMICRNPECAYETDYAWAYYYDDLPIFCPMCYERAMRPKLGVPGKEEPNQTKESPSA